MAPSGQPCGATPHMDELLSSTSHSSPASDPMRDDFKVFLYVVWAHLGLPEPTRSQYAIADQLQHGPKRLIIEAFRGVGKSWVTCAFVCWLLYCNPDLKVLVVSASKLYADQNSAFIQRIINEMPFLAHLRPRDGQFSSRIMFDVGAARTSKDPSVKSVGITGQITGSRADVIIADDVESPGNSATQMMRDKLADLVKEFAAVLKPLESSRIIYLGTPQCEQSLYNRLPERGYEVFIWPSEYPDERRAATYGHRLAAELAEDLNRDPTLAGKPTCTRFPREVLMESFAEYQAAGYALQFLLDTSLSDADRYPLKLHDLIVMDLKDDKAPADLAWANDRALVVDDVTCVGLDGDRYYRPFMVEEPWLPYTGVVMSVDPSGRGSDETGYAVVAMLHGRLFLLDAGGFRNGYSDETLEALAQVAKRYGVNEIVVEPNFGDGMFNKVLQPFVNRIHPCSIIDSERQRNQKEARICDTLEPVMTQHRLVVDRSMIERDYRSTLDQPTDHQMRYRLFYQMTRMTRDRGAVAKDDRLDAVALAVHYWTEHMARDTEKAVQEARADALEAELRGFMENVLGGSFGGTQSVYDRSC